MGRGIAQPRVCLTPETYYGIGLESARIMTVRMRFPFDVECWGGATSTLTEKMSKLEMYDARALERERIAAMVHDAMEPVAADAYRVMREIDKRLGRDTVDYGIAHAIWRRTKQGDRPEPRDNPNVDRGRSGSRPTPPTGDQS